MHSANGPSPASRYSNVIPFALTRPRARSVMAVPFLGCPCPALPSRLACRRAFPSRSVGGSTEQRELRVELSWPAVPGGPHRSHVVVAPHGTPYPPWHATSDSGTLAGPNEPTGLQYGALSQSAGAHIRDEIAGARQRPGRFSGTRAPGIRRPVGQEAPVDSRPCA